VPIWYKEDIMRTNPWAIPINYEKEIAYDEGQVKYYQEPVVVGFAALLEELYANEWQTYSKHPTLTRGGIGWVALARPAAVAKLLGLTEEETLGLSLYLNEEHEGYRTLPEAEFWRLYRIGEAVGKRPGPQACVPGFEPALVEWEICRETARVAGLKHAKTALARHRRNKAKYGR
jgi:hypothetical protein